MIQQPTDITGLTATKGGSRIWRGILGFIFIAAIVIVGTYLLKPPETPYARAVRLVQSSKAAQALPILEELSSQQPDNAKLFPWLAQAYLRTDRLAEGRVALDTALRLNVPNPSLSKTVLAYVNNYLSHGEYEDAEMLFQSAVRACPPNELIEGQAVLYEKWAESQITTNLDSAVKHLERSYQLAAQLPEGFKAVIKHRLSDAYRQQAGIAESKKDDNLAEQILEHSLIVSNEPATRMALAAIYSRQKHVEPAIQNYQIVARADPNNLEARHHLIDLLCQKKDYASAQVALTELVDKEKSVENFQVLANIDLKLGNYAGAVRAYEDAISLRSRPNVLQELLSVLNDWSSILQKQHKSQEALAVKGHADRVADQLSDLTREDKENDKEKADDKTVKLDENRPPVALSFSRIWLAKGSLTPEGEIKIKNTTGKPISDLTLSAVFYDNTARRANGTVSLPVATPESPPFPGDATRSLYFSCPNIIKADHQLAVIIYWQGRFLKEFPVVKL